MATQLNIIIGLLLLVLTMMLFSFGVDNQYLDSYDQEYVVKFTCGVQHASSGSAYGVVHDPVNAGSYTTAINIYNGREPVDFVKRVVLSPREPAFGVASSSVSMGLGTNSATNADCYDIKDILGMDPADPQFIEGFLLIQTDSPLQVTSVYTARGVDFAGQPTGTTNIDVEHHVAPQLRLNQ